MMNNTASSEHLDKLLVSHVIPVADLRADDLDASIRNRASTLIDLIEQATGKAISGRDSDKTVKAFGGGLL